MWKHNLLEKTEGTGTDLPASQTAPLGSAAVPGDIPAPDAPGVDWESLADDPPGASVPPEEEEPNDPPAAPAQPAASAAAPASQPAAQPVAAAPAVPPQQPQAPVQQPQGQQPTPEQLAQQAQEIRTRMRDELASIYTSEFDEDTKAALLADPASVMPRLMSQAAMDGAQLAILRVQEILPQFVSQISTVREGSNQAWTEFNAAHPDLAKPEHRATVQAAIQALKATGQRPADKASAMLSVARTARAMLGLPDPSSAPAPAPDVTAAPVAPHTPVARGRSRPATAAKPSTNPWEDMLD